MPEFERTIESHYTVVPEYSAQKAGEGALRWIYDAKNCDLVDMGARADVTTVLH
jgi:hypothetical protein